ncbi:GntR family transcriptional regulator, arabinose operon transcriptional repressor [Lachnospiraceae bacterium C7]|nr:GntR family transcriptional regulator, arabinose operon transcriptional repressor [Lachnospiraceae bacterium C7]
MNKPKYFRLMDDIKIKIKQKKYTAGMKLPSENDFANEYGISRQTVRKALKALADEGFVHAEHGKGTFVSELARHTKTSKNIAIVTTYLSDYIFPRVIQGIDRVFTENGYSIILKTTRNSATAEARCIEELLSKDIDGMIIEPSKSQIYCKHISLFEQMDEYDIPYVFIQGYFDELRKKPCVIMNDIKGGYLITKYLISQGCKNIYGIFKADDVQGKNRHKGYVLALQEADILYDPDKVIWFHTEDREIKPRESISELIRKEVAIDSVVCYNDQIAVEVIRTFQVHGINVPKDVSVTGFDNSMLAKNNIIPITTVSHPQELLGQNAAELMLKLIRKEAISSEDLHIVMEPEVIVRKSTRIKH